MAPLKGLGSLKSKIAVLAVGSVALSTLLAAAMTQLGLPLWVVVPSVLVVTLALAQFLSLGMTEPLAEMTAAARAMDAGDFSRRVVTDARDEVGDLAHAFNDMAEQLEGLDRQRADVVAAVTAELAPPVPALRRLLETLAAGVVRPTSTTLALALDQADRLRNLVLALATLTRFDTGEAQVEPERVALRPLLQAAVGDARRAGFGTSYDVRLEPFDLTMDTDRALLMLLVACLLDNAARHAGPGGKVVVRGYRTEGRLVLETDDTGGALPAEERLEVAARFTTGTGPEAGTELGLALARWAAEHLDGTLVVLEGRTHGNLVRVSLPYKAVPRSWKGTPRVSLKDETAPPAPTAEPEASPGQPAAVATLTGTVPDEVGDTLAALLEERLSSRRSDEG